MNAPKLAAVIVVVVMLSAFCYIAWTSRQVAQAQAKVRSDPEGRVGHLEKAIEETEKYLGG
ncbi:MAG: hypothetical protein ACYSTL_05725 [Planctomycetota bacterium]|jgi:cell division protein FtsX